MKIYTLYEMVGMLRLGLWQGGMVDKLDYISPVIEEPSSSAREYGVMGVHISYDAMLEGCEVSADAKSCQFDISIYDPYTGCYKIYRVCSSIANREYLWSKLEEVIQDIRQAYVWSHNVNKTNIYHIQRRYGTSHSSMRSGSIGSPRESKIFRR